LQPTAWSADGLIEALEDPRPERFVVGVQWHPELGWKEDRLSQALFSRFIDATKEHLREIGDDGKTETAARSVVDETNIRTREKTAVNLDNLNLRGRVAVVTGGSRGI